MDSDHVRAGSPSGAVEPVKSVLPPIDLVEWLTRHRAVPAPPSQSGADTPARGLPSLQSPSLHGNKAIDRRLRRAAAYVARLPGAIAGQRGHDRTFHAACVLIKDFALTIDEARPLLREWNLGCVPPWSPGELEHRLKSAEAAPDLRPRGYLALRDREPSEDRRSKGPGPQNGVGKAAAPPVDSTPDVLNGQRDARRAASRAGPVRQAAITAESRVNESKPPCPDGQEANPHRLALFLNEQFAYPGGIGLRFWRQEFH
jgi:putative DNA primase/helicase